MTPAALGREDFLHVGWSRPVWRLREGESFAVVLATTGESRPLVGRGNAGGFCSSGVLAGKALGWVTGFHSTQTLETKTNQVRLFYYRKPGTYKSRENGILNPLVNPICNSYANSWPVLNLFPVDF